MFRSRIKFASDADVILLTITNIMGKIFLTSSNALIVHNIFSVIGFCNAIILFLLCKKIQQRITPVSVLYLSYTVFLMGQDILYAFGYTATVSTSSIFRMFSLEELANGVIFTNLLLLMIHFGTTLFRSKDQTANDVQISDVENHKKKNLLYASKFCVYILMLPALYYIFSIARLARSMGYDAMLASSFSQSLVAILCRYALSGLEFALFGLLLACEKKNVRNIIYAGYSVLILFYLFLGERTIPISLGLVLLFIRSDLNRTKKQYSSKKRIVMITVSLVAAYLILIMVSLIQKTRNQGGFISVNQLFDALSLFSGGSFQAVLESLSVMGYSASSLLYTMRYVPSLEPFCYGTTILFGMTTFLPNLFGIFGTRSLGRYSLSKWLMEHLGISYGPGFSIAAEAYINFGWLGPLLGIPFGHILMKLSDSRTHDLIKKTVTYAIYTVIFSLPRRYLGSVVGEIVIGLFPLIFIYYLVNHRFQSGKKITENGR